MGLDKEFEIEDSYYRLDKKETLAAIGLIADSINENSETLKWIDKILAMVRCGSKQEKIEEAILDMKLCVDITDIYMKESKVKMIKLTKNQLPF